MVVQHNMICLDTSGGNYIPEFNSLPPGRCGSRSKKQSPYICDGLRFWALIVKTLAQVNTR